MPFLIACYSDERFALEMNALRSITLISLGLKLHLI